jgi:hypothetical protein
MLFYYSVLPYAAGAHLAASDNPSSLGFYCSGGHTNIHLVEVSYPGVFVDESVRGGAVPRRFYAAIVRHDCP